MMKTVLITGGEQGLGLALSDLFLDNGFRVISFDLKKSKSQKNKEFFEVDISVESQVVEALKNVDDVDILINNAAIMRRGSTFSSSLDDFDALFSVNVKGVWLVTKHVLSKLSFGAKVVMVSSRHSSLPSNPGLYGLSKKNVELLGVLLEKEDLFQRKGLVVKTAILGPFRSKLSETGYDKVEYSRRNLLGCEVVAKKVFDFLLSDEKVFVFNS